MSAHLKSQLVSVKALGVKFIIVCVNFKDNELEKPVFNEVRQILELKIRKAGLNLTAIIPISTHHQDNIFANAHDTFYTGIPFLPRLSFPCPQK